MKSYNFMRGWNCAFNKINIEGRFFDDDARKGYYGYLAADKKDQIPFPQEALDHARQNTAMKPAELIRYLNKKEKQANSNSFRREWYERARRFARRQTRLEESLKLAITWFEEYAGLHEAKGTLDGYEKAIRNRQRADLLSRALTDDN